MHKRTHSADISIEKRKGQLPIANAKPPVSREIPVANSTAFDAKHTLLTIQAHSTPDLAPQLDTPNSGVQLARRSTSRQESVPPIVVNVCTPIEEVDYGNRRLEIAEDRVINVGLKIPSVSDSAGEKDSAIRGRETRARSITSEQVEEKEMWWGRFTGRQRKLSKTRLEV